jgi:threonine/homoserine/homoserine lactone efflux protein
MDSHVWLTLFLAALINAAIPGPILLLVMARAAGGGLRSGLRTALGGALAVALLLAAVWALLFGAWQLGSGLVSALKITGIGVLTILGLRMLRAIPSPGAPLPTRAAAPDPRRRERSGCRARNRSVQPVQPGLLPGPATAIRNPRDHDAGWHRPCQRARPPRLGTAAGRRRGRRRRTGASVARRARWMVRCGGLMLLVFAGIAAATPT